MAAPIYATDEQLEVHGLGPKALGIATTAQKLAARRGASRFADGYLKKRYTLPLIAWEDDLAKAVCQIAAWDLISTAVGYAIDDPAGTNAKLRRDEAVTWLEGVAADEICPEGIVDSSSTTAATDEPTTIAATSDPDRGWDRW